LVEGDKQNILTVFMRVERFITKIAGKKIFEFNEEEEKEPSAPVEKVQ
jgi:hypothetical protein